MAWSAERDERLARAISRCTAFAELVACADALNLNPHDATLLVAEGDALVRQRRPGEAIGVFRNAVKQSGGAVSVKDKIANAEAQRLILLETCQTQDGDAASAACEAAWLPGAPDEAALFQRRGFLLQSTGQLTSALDAYMAAARLRPADRGVAGAIVTLSESTGREDAATLSAKGQALLTLRRPRAALAPLRRALKLSPTLADARAHLKLAEREAVEKTVTVAGDTDEAATSLQAPRYTNEEPLTRSN
jgi:tetratricopeptide (TPR) repeat protein